MYSQQMDIPIYNLVERTVKDSWKIELEKELKKIAKELRKAELDTRQEEEKTNEEYFDVLYAPYIAVFSERFKCGF